MERALLLFLVITAQALFDIIDGTIQLIDSLITTELNITFQPITCRQLREFGARGKTKAQLIASLA